MFKLKFAEKMKEDHRQEVQKLKDEKRDQYDQLQEHERSALEFHKQEIADLKAKLDARNTKIGFLEDKLQFSEEKQDLIIDSKVNSQLGQYEVKYHHDMHTTLEERSEKMNTFQQEWMKSVLEALKDLKPSDPKVYFMGKDAAPEAKPANKQDKQQNNDGAKKEGN